MNPNHQDDKFLASLLVKSDQALVNQQSLANDKFDAQSIARQVAVRRKQIRKRRRRVLQTACGVLAALLIPVSIVLVSQSPSNDSVVGRNSGNTPAATKSHGTTPSGTQSNSAQHTGNTGEVRNANEVPNATDESQHTIDAAAIQAEIQQIEQELLLERKRLLTHQRHFQRHADQLREFSSLNQKLELAKLREQHAKQLVETSITLEF